jgi:caffeic acid 3-O-methyltransferase
LKNYFQALPTHGKVIVLDDSLPEIIEFEGSDHMALQPDIYMMVFCGSGARERTEGELRKLGLAAGFNQVKVVFETLKSTTYINLRFEMST